MLGINTLRAENSFCPRYTDVIGAGALSAPENTYINLFSNAEIGGVGLCVAGGEQSVWIESK
jgi:hypothetical protein